MDDTFQAARKNVKGRGTGELAKGRFERIEVVYEEEDAQQVETQVFRDASRSILARNDSPDVGFSVSLNPYRGCEHGCIYCYARPTHEYFSLSAGLDFESKLFVKTEAPALLRAELRKKSWKPQPIILSGVTDCYQPLERKMELTRSCLQVLAEFRNPAAIITKNHLVTRDIDVLKELASYDAIHVVISITTLDSELARKMEPRASQPKRRLQAIEELSAAGIPVSVNMAPIVPGLTEHEIPTLLKSAADAGARSAHYVMLRLPHSVKDLFQKWLEEHYPMRKEKVLNRIRDVRGGELYDSDFGSRMKGEGTYADHIAQMFAQARKANGLDKRSSILSTAHFKRQDVQLSLL
ncbi:MAG TPA: PA0069 family radical SAM protein [Rickettsiales bacterium]|nr:PA0069 family radical SAM protein [Rickettsiales bacterium]